MHPLARPALSAVQAIFQCYATVLPVVEGHGVAADPVRTLTEAVTAKLQNGMFWNTNIFWKEGTPEDSINDFGSSPVGWNSSYDGQSGPTKGKSTPPKGKGKGTWG